MLLSDFIKRLQDIEEEAKGNPHNKGQTTIDFWIDDSEVSVELIPEDDNNPYDEPCIEPYRNLNCGCWTGAIVHLRIKKE